MPMYATPIFITEFLIVTYVQLFQTIVTVNIKGYTVLAYVTLVSMMWFNSDATPTNDSNHSCHINAVDLV